MTVKIYKRISGLSGNIMDCHDLSGNVRICQGQSGYVMDGQDMSGNVRICQGLSRYVRGC